MHISHVHCWPAQTAFTATVTRTHIGQQAPADGQTMQIGDNYLNDGHFTAWNTPNIRARQCPHAVHHTQIIRASIPCHNGHVWHLAIAVSFEVPDAARRMNTYIADCHGSPVWVVVQGGWPGSDFNVVARCLLLFYKIDIGDLLTPMFRHAPMLPILESQMCTSAKL